LTGNWTIELLREARIPFKAVPHQPAPTASQGALANTPWRDRAKVVVCFIDDRLVEAVLPAPSIVNLDRLLDLADGRSIRFADEEDLRRLSDAGKGAAPAVGARTGQMVFVDAGLAAKAEIVLITGSDCDAMAVRWNDFVRTVNPIVGRFAELPLDRVPAYRLSYRE
jgi:prolyl-tRNA editing enzyme YbaK/EbsC (Cys-tRNA(Pro) deacylase)